jgi:hypothetical protein
MPELVTAGGENPQRIKSARTLLASSIFRNTMMTIL